MKRISAQMGEHIIQLVVRGLREARYLNKPVELAHNGKVVVVHPHNGEDEVYQTFVGDKQRG
jgi:hypothetical protein